MRINLNLDRDDRNIIVKHGDLVLLNDNRVEVVGVIDKSGGIELITMPNVSSYIVDYRFKSNPAINEKIKPYKKKFLKLATKKEWEENIEILNKCYIRFF